MKYLYVRLAAGRFVFIFMRKMQHITAAKMVGADEILSAGFCWFDGDMLKIKGESITLGVQADPDRYEKEINEAILNDASECII